MGRIEVEAGLGTGENEANFKSGGKVVRHRARAEASMTFSRISFRSSSESVKPEGSVRCTIRPIRTRSGVESVYPPRPCRAADRAFPPVTDAHFP